MSENLIFFVETGQNWDLFIADITKYCGYDPHNVKGNKNVSDHKK